MHRRLMFVLPSFTPLLALACALLAWSPPVKATELMFDPAHAKAPPQVAAATIELLAQPTTAGNAVVRMQFTDRRSRTPVVIQGGPGPALLRDDGIAPDTRAGDGRYAAVVRSMSSSTAARSSVVSNSRRSTPRCRCSRRANCCATNPSGPRPTSS